MMECAGVADSFVYSITSRLTTWIYTFHMPVFISLSGAVYILQKGRYSFLAEITTAKLSSAGFLTVVSS